MNIEKCIFMPNVEIPWLSISNWRRQHSILVTANLAQKCFTKVTVPSLCNLSHKLHNKPTSISMQFFCHSLMRKFVLFPRYLILLAKDVFYL